MFTSLARKVFGSRNDRILKKINKANKHINALETELQALSDAEIQAKTAELKNKLATGSTLDSLLSEAFAVVREASVRVYGMRPFDVQLTGATVLHQGKIAEMRTGEGKTLTSTLATYLNAITGRGVHVITVNDYLAKRDADWSRELFSFLGLTVGCNIPGLSYEEKRAAYACDITYGTNNEFGFDYLRDNMAFSPEDRVQRELHYAVIDEVDSILIDEARTPLIISGAADDSSALYKQINALVPKLAQQDKEDEEGVEGDGHFTIDEKGKQVYLTEKGQIFVEELLIQAGILAPEQSLFSSANIALLQHVNSALKAHKLFTKDVDYIVKDGEIVIVDEHTGRTMEGRRWSEGLHQAVEAKEGVKIHHLNYDYKYYLYRFFFSASWCACNYS